MELHLEANLLASEMKEKKARLVEIETRMQNKIEDATYVNTPNSNERIVQWKNGSRSQLNQKALKEDMPELWQNEKYINKSTFRTFKIL